MFCSTVEAKDLSDNDLKTNKEASRLMKEGQYNIAARYFETLFEQYPENYDVQLNLAFCLVQGNESTDKAKQLLENLSENGYYKAEFILYKLYYNKYQFNEAKKFLEKFNSNARFYEKFLFKANIENNRLKIAENAYSKPYKLDVSAKLKTNQIKLVDKFSYLKGIEIDKKSITSNKKSILLKSSNLNNKLSFEVRAKKFPPYDKDIYYSITENGITKGPYPIKAINTKYDEAYPFFDPVESKLYYSSNGKASLGKNDIFYSNWNSITNEFSEPDNLGFPINTPFDELYFVKGTDQYGIATNRNQKQNEYEIIIFKRFYKDSINSANSTDIAIKARLDIKVSTTEPIFRKQLKSDKNLNKQTEINKKTFQSHLYKFETEKALPIIKTYSILDSIESITYKYRYDLSIETNTENRKTLFSKIKKEETQLKRFYFLLDSICKAYSTVDSPQSIPSVKKIKQSEFSISNPNSNGKNNTIPSNIQLPQGLVYRIQIGAFSQNKDISFFKGIQPLSSEEITEPSLIKYYAGFFYSYEEASKALKNIKDCGFSNAYIVAFYDTKRLSIEKAIDLETFK